jgi:hypothetical protein
MEGMSRLDVRKLMERYIGSSGGYLGTFDSHPTLSRFYIECELDINPKDYPGTNKDRFQAILEGSPPETQAKIIRGILKRHPVGSAESRTQTLHDEFLFIAQRLEAGAGIANPTPAITSEFVERTLSEVEHLVKTKGATSGGDRVHSALHGYLRVVCDKAGIAYVEGDRIEELFKKIRAGHAAFAVPGPRAQDIVRVTDSFCSIMNVLDPIRNRSSFAHPTKGLLDVPEAMLVINAARTILHYLDAKLAAVA